MLELFVWFILFLLLTGGVSLVYHWIELFRLKEEYTRDELTDLRSILLYRFRTITGESTAGTILSGAGVVVAWGVIAFGGLVSPDVTAAPDYAEGVVSNYFFQSIFLPVLLHIAWPGLDTLISQKTSALRRKHYPFLATLSLSFAAANLSFWGVYHRFSFLFVLINASLLIIYVLFLFELQNRAGTDDDETLDATPVEEGEDFDDLEI